MANGQEEIKTDSVSNDATNEVKNEKPVSKVEENDAKETSISEEPSSELLTKIKNQIEFYFGDVNMQRDKFLIQQTKLDEGWVPMSVMLKFKMLASMSQDVDVILKALESSELIEVSEDKKKIRRSLKHPLPDYNVEYRKAQEARTAYVKGFPLKNMTMEKLKTFFNAYEPYETIIMRKYSDKDKKLQFKGSIFIQFKTLDDAKAFMDRGPIKYEETELIKKWSYDYTMGKLKEKEDRRQKRSDMKTKKNDTVKAEDDGSLSKGSVIHFCNVPEKCTREDIKNRVGELDANIAYVEFKIGDEEGWIRFQGENAAKSVFDKMEDGKLLICDKEVTFRVLEGEEEETYLTKAKEKMDSIRQKYSKPKRTAKKRGRKGRLTQRKRRGSNSSSSSGSDSDDATPGKKAAIE